jgi:hypothetical protein
VVQAEGVLSAEEERVDSYLHASTKPKLLKVCALVLLLLQRC